MLGHERDGHKEEMLDRKIEPGRGGRGSRSNELFTVSSREVAPAAALGVAFCLVESPPWLQAPMPLVLDSKKE